jgi:SWI/SNF-related matrix-associated actin-dependent regulator 1 of chromatin subfamily A
VPSIDEIEQQRKELLDKIAELDKLKVEEANRIAAEILKQEEIDRQRELTQPVTVTATQLTPTYNIICKGKHRPDIVAEFMKTSGRFSDGVQSLIPIKSWRDLTSRLEALPNVTVEYQNGIKEKIESLLNGPDWSISLTVDKLRFVVKPSPLVANNVLQSLPGARWMKTIEAWYLPLVEGWRLVDTLRDFKVEWTDEAKELILTTTERRAKLDAIATKKDSDLVIPLREGELKPFQKVGVEFIDATGGRTFLADQMGLGKTWQAIAYALHRNLRSVIVCPASLKINWAREIKRLTGETAYVCYGQEPGNHDIAKIIGDRPKFVIINYDIIGKKILFKKETKDAEGYTHTEEKDRWLWAEVINMSQPQLIILDEAHYIKNMDALRTRACLTLSAPSMLPMSGTPITNRPGDFFPALHLLYPNLFPSYESYIYSYTYDGRGAKNVEELRSLLKGIMIRRLKKDVVAELPPINRVYDWHELSPKGSKLYSKALESVYHAIEMWDNATTGDDKGQRISNILVKILRLKQICAIDKADRIAEMATEMNDSANGEGTYKKVIIFSQFKTVVRAISRRLGHEAIAFTGDTGQEERQRLVDQFQTDEKVRFLVVTSQVAGEGLNLTKAGYVIFADLMWTPARHMQCEERAYGRLNELHSIDAYYVVVQNSIEEWIQQILDRKLSMINQVVEGIEGERDSSVAMELIERIKSELFSKRRIK